ncbi:sensor histidine kinase [Maribellus luteus]|uniref:histidine kinase n=1 Tax=Maribellus luteus TaxID=2305463 RepID=A0A399SW29_9BACT|nr:HAMP domain-containing sensor histidine kinase [Maribellus luteus]RIJ47668.1 sensor histidine kinase [Maribellus luteus]
MKLVHRITIRISTVLLLLLTVWASIFYFILMDEINDETDDSLEDYSEQIITLALAGRQLPSENNGTNNSYFIRPVTNEYAAQHEGFRYSDEMVYIESKKETEPARILKTIFRNSNDQFFELTVAIPTIEKDDLQETILYWIIFLYLLLLVSIALVNFWILRQSFRPLYALLSWLRSYTIGQKIPVLSNSTKVEEFKRLNEAMLKTARRNAEMYEQQKLFIGHASHEIQTPLAVCKNRLELLMNDPELSEKQLKEILKTLEDLEHLVKLNRTLLLLTKIDNFQFQDTKTININDLTKKLLDDFNEVFAHQNIDVNIEESSILQPRMNETLSNILIRNLLKNAFVHNQEYGQVSVFIQKSELIVENSGQTRALPEEEIFKRFYQGSKKAGSTGLGLALVNSICKLYNIKREYTFNNDRHRFRLVFPASILI